MDATLRFGLVGYGFGGRYFHAPLIAATPGCALAGVVTRSPVRRAEVAHDHSGVPVFDSVSALVESGVDAVAVSTPAQTHVAVVTELVERGIPVVCDKPFATDARAAREVVELAESRGVLVSPYQNRRWDSDYLTVRRLLESGALGEVVRFESAFERWSADPAPPPAGGGLLRDFGSHLVDQAVQLFGTVESVYAATHQVAPDIEDDFTLILRHRDGTRSHLSGGWRQGAPAPRFRVSGTEGTFVMTTPMDGQEQALIDGRSPADDEAWGEEPASTWGAFCRGSESVPVPSERGRWDLYYEAFAEAVRERGPAPVDPWDAVATAAVLDAARRSAAEGRSVEVPAIIC